MTQELQAMHKNLQYFKFSAYGFLKDLRFYEPFLLLMFVDKGLTFFQIGALYAIREVSVNIMEIPSGVIADAMGRRRTMVFSFVGYIVSFVAFFVAQSWWSLALAMVLYAVGDAFRTGTHKAMIFDYLKRQGWEDLKTSYYGHTRGWSQRGAALSALLAGVLVLWQGNYQTIFLFSILPYLLDQGLILSYPAYLDGPRASKRLSLAKEFSHVGKAFSKSMKDLFVLRAIGSQALHTGFYKAIKDYIQVIMAGLALGLPFLGFLTESQRVAVVVGALYSILYLFTAQASRNSGNFAKGFKALATPLNLTLAIGLALGVIGGLGQGLGLAWLALLAYAGVFLVENLLKPMGIVYVSDLMDQDALATALSAESQAETLVSASLALAFGFLSDLLGLGYGLALGSGICLVLAWFLRLPKDNPRPQ